MTVWFKPARFVPRSNRFLPLKEIIGGEVRLMIEASITAFYLLRWKPGIREIVVVRQKQRLSSGNRYHKNQWISTTGREYRSVTLNWQTEDIQVRVTSRTTLGRERSIGWNGRDLNGDAMTTVCVVVAKQDCV